LRQTFTSDKVVSEKPKGAEEGFESRITWPAAIAKSNGIVKDFNENRIQYKRNVDQRTISLQLTKRNIKMIPIVGIGEEVYENKIIASVVPVALRVPKKTEVDQNHYLRMLSGSSISDRYAAAKALSFFQTDEVITQLINKINDSSEHIYIKLEAAASLSRAGEKAGWDFIANCLTDDYLQNRLEAVIILAEIKSGKSCELLCEVLQDGSQNPEIRAGAAWGLGELSNKIAINVLINCFLLVDDEIKIEAARALLKLNDLFSTEILDKFKSAADINKPGIAWAINKSGKFDFDSLLEALGDEESRIWISYIIGNQTQEEYIDKIEKLKMKDKEVYFAVTVLWKILSSWVYGLEEY